MLGPDQPAGAKVPERQGRGAWPAGMKHAERAQPAHMVQKGAAALADERQQDGLGEFGRAARAPSEGAQAQPGVADFRGQVFAVGLQTDDHERVYAGGEVCGQKRARNSSLLACTVSAGSSLSNVSETEWTYSPYRKQWAMLT